MNQGQAAQLESLARAAECLSRPGELLPALEQSLNDFCGNSFFAAASLRLLRGNRIEDAVSAGDPALRAAVKAPILRVAELPAPGTSTFWRASMADSRAEALRAANLGGFVTAPLDWGSERFGLLELFLQSPEEPQPEALAAASIAAQLVTSRIACAQENTFRDFFENAGVGLGIGTADGDVLRVNRVYAEFLGRKPDELAGTNARQVIAPEFLPETMQSLRALARGDVDRLDLESRYLRREGALVWGRTAVTRLGKTGLLVAVVHDIDAMKRAEEAVRKLSGRLLHLQDDERRRIARSLHESAAQTVAALSMSLQRMERMSLPAHAIETLADSLDLVGQCSREIRTLSHLLHPPLLEEAGLPSSLRWYVQGFGTRSNVEVNMELADDFGRLPTELEITLFRVVQESLTNVHRHAGAQRATIRMRRAGPEIVLEIEDDGIGIPSDVMDRVRTQSAASVGVGIAGMRERISQLGGTLEIHSSPRGTVVRARLRSER
jgi:PAS domain S-box-containing protein